MLTYTPLSIKYKPKRFKDIIGQSHISRIVQNAIKLNKINHAYLINGIYGIGKTTIAKIMAISFNCINLKNKISIIEPCFKCNNCILILNKKQNDIVEIDAASNTGVNNIRLIINSFQYKPIDLFYKIFIIDEAHMLSNSSFNALLKSIEEPPKYVKFILITTLVSKLPMTVISRCQRLDLYRLATKNLIIFLKNIVEKEGFYIEEEAAIILANSSKGSVRNALSFLDQTILVSKNKKIFTQNIINIMGLINNDIIYIIFTSLITSNIQKVLFFIRNLYYKGISLYNIITSIADITYKISLCQIGKIIDIISSSELKFCQEQSDNLSILIITRLWHMLNYIINSIYNSYNELYAVEMGFIKIIYMNFSITLEDLLQLNNQILIKKKIY